MYLRDELIGKLKFKEGVEFSFPQHLCCNCGVKKGVSLVEQDTRRTTYLLAGGIETTFRLPLPFCTNCVSSAKRRPKNMVHRILLLTLSFALWFAALVLMGVLSVLPSVFADYMAHIAGALAILTTLGVVLLSRPEKGQSSYFQPVRIPTLKKEFLSGEVTAISFSFTNKEYARAFHLVNKEAITNKYLIVE